MVSLPQLTTFSLLLLVVVVPRTMDKHAGYGEESERARSGLWKERREGEGYCIGIDRVRGCGGKGEGGNIGML